jgi:hypothetical protein
LVVLATNNLQMPGAGRLGTVTLLFTSLLAYAWPLFLAAALRGARRPQLLTAAGVATLAWGMALFVGRLLGAYLLSKPEPWSRSASLPTLIGIGPRHIPQDVTQTLLDPVQLVMALVLMVAHAILAGRAWRVRSEFRAIQGSSPISDDPTGSKIEIRFIVISIVLALAVAFVPGGVVWAARG